MIATLSDFESAPVPPSPVYFALVDASLAMVQAQEVSLLSRPEATISLEALFNVHKSVVVEEVITLDFKSLAVTAQIDGADYPTFILLRSNHIQHRIDGILDNYCLSRDGLIFTRIKQPGAIQHLCFSSLKCRTRYLGEGFCTPIRQHEDVLYVLQENHQGARLFTLPSKETSLRLVSETHRILVHAHSGMIWQDEKGNVSVWRFNEEESQPLPTAKDYALSGDVVFLLCDDGVYKCPIDTCDTTRILETEHDTLLYTDQNWILTTDRNYLNQATYTLYDRVRGQSRDFGETLPPPPTETTTFSYQGYRYSFQRFRGNGKSLTRSVIISVYEGFDTENVAVISEFDRRYWLDKGHDIICFNALNRIKELNPHLSNTEAKLRSLALLAAFCDECKLSYDYANIVLVGVSHGGMMVLSSALTTPAAADLFVAISPLVNLRNIVYSDYFLFWQKEFDHDAEQRYLALCPTHLLNTATAPITGLIISFEGDQIVDSKAIASFAKACAGHAVEHIHFEQAQGHAKISDYNSTNEGYKAVYHYIERKLALT
ncbi:alpha/beta hydrolase family protein [Salinivibrio kushneri]|uniref:alpha/beta hydrolase family protein n=1 Tax=Salinivibrio kushneri TaxID=1908198 RepID=UPI0009847D16|nr:prolyl oligopeptidase family serine peptidase [Salinivibrio kushneri]OOE46018.1 hypothetical protein BZG10_14080 [Salinivibrio kushneri]OOE59583.1 hypothetical protein BZG18_13095 [Salinivibrio kushneri]